MVGEIEERKGKGKRPATRVTGLATIFVALTWLSLARLLPSRALLRLARPIHNNKSSSFIGGQQLTLSE